MSTLTAEQKAANFAEMMSSLNLDKANVAESNLETTSEFPGVAVGDIVEFLKGSGFEDTYFSHNANGHAFVLAWSKTEGKRFFINFFTSDYKKPEDSIHADITELTEVTFREAKYKKDFTYVHPKTKAETEYKKDSTIYSFVLAEV